MKNQNRKDEPATDEFEFKPITLEITLENLSTQKTISSRDTPLLTMIELVDNGFQLQTPSNFCNKKDAIRILLETKGTQDPVSLQSEALVKKIETSRTLNYQAEAQVELQESAIDQVTLALTRCEPGALEEFRKVFDSRQSNIDLFFHLAKGLPSLPDP